MDLRRQMQCMTYTNASAGNNKLLKPQTNCKPQLSSNFVYTSDVPECIFCSARFAKVDLFTFLEKEKEKIVTCWYGVHSDFAFSTCFISKNLNRKKGLASNYMHGEAPLDIIMQGMWDRIEKFVLLYHYQVLLWLNSYHHHSYKAITKTIISNEPW